MSKKKFITNLALLLALNILIKPFWILGIDRGIQNLVGAEEYGLYFALFNLSLVLNILLDLGITNFNNRNISQHSFLLNKHLSSLVVLKIMLAALYTVVLIAIGLIFGYDSRKIWMLFWLGGNQFLLSLILYLRSNIAGLQLFKTDSFISILDRLLMIIICGGILFSASLRVSFTIEHFIYIQTLCYTITALATLVIVIKKSRLKKLRWNPIMLRIILKQSFPFAVLVLLMAFYNRIDTVMLLKLLPDGAEQSGIYAQAYRLLDSANMIAYLFSVLLLPIFSRMLKHKEKVSDISQLAFRLLFIPALILVGISISYNREIMLLLYPKADEESIVILPFLMACFLPICSSYVYGTLLTANGSLRELNIIAFVSMSINIILNIILIPIMKAQGAAIASFSTQTFNSLAQMFIIRKRFNSKTNYSFILLLSAYALTCILGIYIASKFLPFTWIVNLLICGLVSMALAFATNLISLKGVYKIAKAKELG